MSEILLGLLSPIRYQFLTAASMCWREGDRGGLAGAEYGDLLVMNAVLDCDSPKDDVEVVQPRREPVESRDVEIFAVIDGRRLERECFLRSIELLHPRVVVLGYSKVEDCLESAAIAPTPNVIIYNIGSRSFTDPEVVKALRRIVEHRAEIPVVVLAESEELEQILAAFEAGARGYIPVSIGIDAIIEATKLTSSGGAFLTAGSLVALRHASGPKPAPAPLVGLQLTSRQTSVAEALRRGKANKMIAYELNMCESTVKVHIRNIMKKLEATNRTEAAFKLNAVQSSRAV